MSNEALRLADSIHEMNNAAYMTAIANLNEKVRQQAERIAELEAEVLEQARCNGMGAERELALVAERDQLRAEVELYREFFDADQLVNKIMDEVSPGLTSPKGPEYAARVDAAINRRCAAVSAIDNARATHKDEE